MQHEPSASPQFNDATENVVSFVDGHVSYIRIYLRSTHPSYAVLYDPPTDYMIINGVQIDCSKPQNAAATGGDYKRNDCQ